MAFNKPHQYPYYPRPQDVPTGFEIINEGTCRRGDRYWQWFDRKWILVSNVATFLHSPVWLVKCVIRPKVKDSDGTSTPQEN